MMIAIRSLAIAVILTTCIAGCATPYQPLTVTSMTGGFKVKQIEGDIYRVLFSANGYSSRETAQTYWLYQCASLAIEKGFAGFEILSNINLVMQMSPEEFFAPAEPMKKVQIKRLKQL